MSAPIVHATLIAARRDGRWCGALLQGASGVGKSDLALRAVARGGGWRLVADDRVRVWTSAGFLYGAAPARLAGLIEARTLGLCPLPALAFARIALAVQGRPAGAPLERMPDPGRLTLCGVALPSLELALCEASALAKLDQALDQAIRANPHARTPHGAAGGQPAL